MKNVVFDIGNVLVKWSPQIIIKTVFQDDPQNNELMQKIFKSDIWHDLHLGKITEKEAVHLYKKYFPGKEKQFENLMDVIKKSFTPLEGSFELLERVYQSGRRIYSITDNVKEFVIYMKQKYNFFNKFNGAVISAEVGLLKPDPRIFKLLLECYGLEASETLFLDDILANVESARQVGMHALQFTTAKACELELKNKFGIILKSQ